MTSEVALVTVGEHSYRIDRMAPLQSFHVARKLSIVLIGLNELEKSAADEEITPATWAKAMVTLSGQIGETDMNSCVASCLSVVSRQMANGAGWAKMTAPTGALMFQDLPMPEMLELMWHVIKVHGLHRFFDIAPSTSAGGAEPAPAS